MTKKEMEQAAIYIAALQKKLNEEQLTKEEQTQIENEMSFYIEAVTKDSPLEEMFALYDKVEKFLTN